MALWGTADSIISTGTVTVNYADKTVTGSGTSFTAATAGSVITVGTGGTFGEAVISGITSDTLISIASTDFLSGAAISGVAYTMSQKPVYLLQDSNYNILNTSSSTNAVYGVDANEAASNVTTQYAVTHAGWVGIKTYVDASGNLRVKSETLVAFSGISTGDATYGSFGDALDDTVFPDRYITITAQPVSLSGVSTTSAQTFSVTAAATPTASLSYQWQYSSTGVAYTNLTNAGLYSNVTTATVGIASTTVTANRPDGYYYRVNITADGGASATSDIATLVYA
jgi:hypothetical protein